ncbi:TRAP transporter large permease [Sneathiella litorea]|uniref:TRAP transporter large permease protein n=1 Tax=Sneathiella litorea TaxID=2606216 RepID=A0A6L8W8Y2_9PROT|nr:TRAP transporter large permease [Sneathiella litorea]MZR30687.1 TRAP transporter large permease subunit [Sneathiella litorea]
MTSLEIGLAGIGVLFLLLALRVPIGVVLGVVSLGGIYLLLGERATIGVARSMAYEFVAKWELSAIPLFLLMGSIAFHSGLTHGLFECARLWLSRLPGGLAVATNYAAAGFSAATGSSLATSAAMARLAVPEMLRRGYDPTLATSVVAASGTIGSMIPPSIPFVLFGMFAGVSISKLLLAGILPGILTAFVYGMMIIFRCWMKPSLAPASKEDISWRMRLRALREIAPLPLLIFAVMGSMYSGLATATEAAGFGAFASIIIAMYMKTMTREVLYKSIFETLASTGTIFFIGIGAALFSRFLAFAGLPQLIGSMAEEFTYDPMLLLMIVPLVYLLLGMFLDPMGLLLLTIPIFLPFFQAAGFDLIWMGVLVVKFIEISLITPPVGLSAFVVRGVVGDTVPLGKIFRGLTWFLLAEVIIVALLITFPEISLVIPNAMDE